MSNSGAVTLGDIAGRVKILEIECRDCGRYGRYQLARLIQTTRGELWAAVPSGNSRSRLPAPAFPVHL